MESKIEVPTEEQKRVNCETLKAMQIAVQTQMEDAYAIEGLKPEDLDTLHDIYEGFIKELNQFYDELYGDKLN